VKDVMIIVGLALVLKIISVAVVRRGFEWRKGNASLNALLSTILYGLIAV
jgi:hypothetical protein